MKTLTTFERQEYEKIISTLGISESERSEFAEETDFFNAWNFGQSEKDYEFFVVSSLSE